MTTITLLQSRGYTSLAGAIMSGAYVPPHVIAAIPSDASGDWGALDAALNAERAEVIADDIMSGVEENVHLNDGDYSWDPAAAYSLYSEGEDYETTVAADEALYAQVLRILGERLAAAQAEHLGQDA